MSQEDDRRIDFLLGDAVTRLAAASDSPRLDAELLLCHSIDLPRSYLFAHPEDVLDDTTFSRFDALLQRRLGGEPMAYIMGSREFWSHELLVSPATLVPRPETELLVDLALREIPRKAEWQILDLGTGSGAIAVALAAERLMCEITAVDISEAALAIARENARQLALSNITFAHGSWCEPVRGRQFDIIVSNPPYVRAGDAALTKLRYEPVEALVAGVDGLDAIRTLVADCGQILKSDGVLLIEHGANQYDEVAAILAASGWIDILNHKDFAGHPRVTAARRGGT
ncbi:MAG: peptide chain release factor N(5)-glutamine methyltransferase [Gammaproteobacteria bacterium]|nr:peptide chain release factor N(5)-glutamine methyltransferase [Gammaproteobacteria bacterium]MDH3577730.1 peptide chain release factor N(5)-glutamine methyltransferase [Gammaproteobacteria bacterium]